MDEMPSHYREATEQDPFENLGAWIDRRYAPGVAAGDKPKPSRVLGWTPLLEGGYVECEATSLTKDESITRHADGWSHNYPIVAWLKYVGDNCFVVEMV